jgi:hypothetical protein
MFDKMGEEQIRLAHMQGFCDMKGASKAQSEILNQIEIGWSK